ncbi:MAG TPA: DoxX family protein [Thermoanaerobaculia bacterium]|nr:DoxX family protein [Thermoanaerobaculia bacterium]
MNDAEGRRIGWAVFFARAVLGLIFFMAGVHKVFVLGPVGHVRRYFLPYEDTFLPTWVLWTAGFLIPFVELLAGALVMIGLRARPALIALGCVLIVVTFGHLLREPLYPFHQHVFPRLVLLLFVLLVPEKWDRVSLDRVLHGKRGA